MKFLPVILATALAFDGPLQACTGAAGDLLTLESLSIDPYPIQKNKNVTIAARGSLSAPVVKGATVAVQILLGSVPAFSKTADLCDEGAKAGINCPIPEGPQTISQTQEIPGNVPAGQYGIKIVAKNPDGKEITCMQGKIKIVN